MLEENRDLLNDMTSREHCKEGAAQIPKLLLDLFSQANNQPKTSDEEGESSESANSTVSSAQEISHNLPKVWKVLIELLNHQQLKPVQIKVPMHFLSFGFFFLHCLQILTKWVNINMNYAKQILCV